MSNKLFQAMGGNPYAQMMGQIGQFAQTLKGDPKQMVMQLLNSGKMSQDEFNKLAQQARQIAPFFGGNNMQ